MIYPIWISDNAVSDYPSNERRAPEDGMVGQYLVARSRLQIYSFKIDQSRAKGGRVPRLQPADRRMVCQSAPTPNNKWSTA
jgi:hypothetical protein